MPVKVLRDGREVEYKYAEDGGDGKSFLLRSDDGDEMAVEVPLELDTSFSKKKFDIYFLCKRDLKESDIFQVYVSGTRVGWVIPTLALSSSEHGHADNEHFLKYAYAVIRESLKQVDDSIFTRVADGSNGKIGFAEVFHDFTAILAISCEKLRDEVKFDIYRSTPSLIKYGYVHLGTTNPDQVKLKMSSPSEIRLPIEQVSPSIESEKLISEILNHSFAVEESPIFKFFLIYQLFELLIDEIYKIEQTTLVTELLAMNGDTGKTKECLEKLNHFMSEKHRLNLLVTTYSPTGASLLSDLKDSCNTLLRQQGKDAGEDFSQYFYRVRNFVFHQYRNLPSTQRPLLDTIVNELLEVLPGILARFNVPPLPANYGNSN